MSFCGARNEQLVYTTEFHRGRYLGMLVLEVGIGNDTDLSSDFDYVEWHLHSLEHNDCCIR